MILCNPNKGIANKHDSRLPLYNFNFSLYMRLGIEKSNIEELYIFCNFFTSDNKAYLHCMQALLYVLVT
jgi:hypothetical protein